MSAMYLQYLFVRAGGFFFTFFSYARRKALYVLHNGGFICSCEWRKKMTINKNEKRSSALKTRLGVYLTRHTSRLCFEKLRNARNCNIPHDGGDVEIHTIFLIFVANVCRAPRTLMRTETVLLCAWSCAK
jgi:hypothetical protein